jgi:predicted DCC family thiol-disulfide oxidoreductase YuxK
MEKNIQQNLILFDGVCNLCNGFVQFVIRHDKKKKFKFSSLQSSFSQALIAENYPELKEMKTIAYITNGEMMVRSTAALYILKDLGGIFSLTFGAMIIPAFIRDFFYNWLSARRYKFFGKSAVCMVPTAELRERFFEGNEKFQHIIC